MAVNGFTNIVTDGLVLSLDAGNLKSYPTSGTTWTDLSKNGNNGTLTNGPTFDNSNTGGIVFATDDYVLLPNGLLSGTGNFTVNQWIKWTSGTYGALFGNYPIGNLQVGYGTNLIYVYLGSTSSTSCYLGTSPFSTTLPQFTTNPVMVTAQRSSNTLLLYLNGVLQKTGSTTDSVGTASSQFRIGTNTNNTGAIEAFNGLIYSTQVYNRALSASEVLQNYNATKWRFI
jgi:hypothetical protein